MSRPFLSNRWFPPEHGSSRQRRLVGLWRVLAALALLGAGFVTARVHMRWLSNATAQGSARAAALGAVLVGCIALLRGTWGLVSGLPQGTAPSTRAGRVIRNVLAAVGGLGTLVALFVLFATMAPEPEGNVPREPDHHERTFRLPGENEDSVRYELGGDAAIVIRRVRHDGGAGERSVSERSQP